LHAGSGKFGSQKSLGPLEKPLEIADYSIFSRIQKITSQTIRISGALVFLCTGAIISPTFCVKGNLGVVQVLAHSKNASKSLIMCFARIKKIREI